MRERVLGWFEDSVADRKLGNLCNNERRFRITSLVSFEE